MSVVAVVGNPRPGSRTHGAATAAAEAIAGGREVEVVDLARLAERVLVRDDDGRRGSGRDGARRRGARRRQPDVQGDLHRACSRPSSTASAPARSRARRRCR